MPAIKSKNDPLREVRDLLLWVFFSPHLDLNLFLLTTKLFHKFKPESGGTIVRGLLEISHTKGSAKQRDKVGKGFFKYYLKETN